MLLFFYFTAAAMLTVIRFVLDPFFNELPWPNPLRRTCLIPAFPGKILAFTKLLKKKKKGKKKKKKKKKKKLGLQVWTCVWDETTLPAFFSSFNVIKSLKGGGLLKGKVFFLRNGLVVLAVLRIGRP